MDLSCIILSGDLELYVLGLLPKEEAYQIEQLSLLFPEVKSELDRISQSLEGLAATAVATPSPAVKTRLMAQLRTLKVEEQQTAPKATAVNPLNKAKPIESTPVVAMENRRSNRSALLAAAAIALVVSVGGLIYLALQNKQEAQQVAALQQRVEVLQQNTNLQQQQLQASAQTLQLWQSTDVRKINLTSVPGKPEALAQVFWNAKTSEVYISDVSLPPTPAGKQYQLWAIVDGKPVDAGMLSSQKNHVQKMKAFATADAFAITLEKQGGSATPTMEEMYVMAKAT